jgi:uncharacterized protein YndB with AHSA1/START domain
VAAEPYRDSIFIKAPPDQVFEYFVRPDALVRWMGDRAIVNPRPGGEFTLFFDDRCVKGRYVEIDRPRRLVITWGRDGSREMPPFSSTLEVSFVSEAEGTRVMIVHHGLPESEALRHALGWRHYLVRLQVLGSGQEPEPHRTPDVLTAGVDE